MATSNEEEGAPVGEGEGEEPTSSSSAPPSIYDIDGPIRKQIKEW